MPKKKVGAAVTNIPASEVARVSTDAQIKSYLTRITAAELTKISEMENLKGKVGIPNGLHLSVSWG